MATTAAAAAAAVAIAADGAQFAAATPVVATPAAATEAELDEVGLVRPGRVYRNQEVRLAFREAARNADTISVAVLPDVLVKLSLALPLDELKRRFPYEPSHGISYDEFVSAMGDVLFGLGSPMMPLRMPRRLDTDRERTMSISSTTTSATHITASTEPVNKLTNWINDLLNLSRDALRAPVEQPGDAIADDDGDGDDDDDDDDDDPGDGNHRHNSHRRHRRNNNNHRHLQDDADDDEATSAEAQQLLLRMRDASDVERRELRRDREAALSKLQELNDELGLSEEQYLSLQGITATIVDAFRARQLEIDRQKDLIADLIQRLRHKTALRDDKNDQPRDHTNQTRSAILIAQARALLDDPKLASQSDNERRSCLDACCKLLDECTASITQEAEMRRGIAEDNGWLWMQVTQLQKQLEVSFAQRSARTTDTSTCTIQ